MSSWFLIWIGPIPIARENKYFCRSLLFSGPKVASRNACCLFRLCTFTESFFSQIPRSPRKLKWFSLLATIIISSFLKNRYDCDANLTRLAIYYFLAPPFLQRLLLDAQNCSGESALFRAMFIGRASMAALLLDEGAASFSMARVQEDMNKRVREN